MKQKRKGSRPKKEEYSRNRKEDRRSTVGVGRGLRIIGSESDWHAEISPTESKYNADCLAELLPPDPLH